MTTEFDDMHELDDMRAISRATSSTATLQRSQEFLDAIFSTYRDVPIHGDEDNVTGFRKLFGATSAVTSTSAPVRRVAPKVELQDPLGGFDESGMEKLLKAERSQLPGDHLYARRHFPAALKMVTDFTKRVGGVNDNNREQVREAEARVIASILEHLETATEGARAGRL